MEIKNRIKEIKKIRLGDINHNPSNWRTHPESQRSAFKGILQEIGWASIPIVYHSEKTGGLTLIDGELRKEENPDMEVDVAILDINDAEADVLLKSFDALTSLAVPDPQAFLSLDAPIQNPDLRHMLEDMNQQMAAMLEKTAKNKAPSTEPELKISPELLERHDYLVFYFDNDLDWQVACERFGIEQVLCGPVGNKTIQQKGLSRVLPGSQLLESTQDDISHD
jgi:hypothetical protein